MQERMNKDGTEEIIWKFGRASTCRVNDEFGLPGTLYGYPDGAREIHVEVGKSREREIPRQLFQDAEMGPRQLTITADIEPGLYTWVVRLQEPAVKIDVRFRFDGRIIAQNRVYRDADDRLQVIEHRYPFVVTSGGKHEWSMETFSRKDYSAADLHGFVNLDAIRVERRAASLLVPERWKEHPGKVHLDLWGWFAPFDYLRRRPAGPKYFRVRAIEEPWKWGANLIQHMPYLVCDHWRLLVDGENTWTDEAKRDYLRFAHEKGFVVDEHFYPPLFDNSPEGLYSTNETFRLVIDPNAQRFANARDYGWRRSTDGWDTEEMAFIGCGIFSSEEAIIRANHRYWSHNPGFFLNHCAHTNVGFANPGHSGTNLVDYFRGPNFIQTPACGSLSYDDLEPLRTFIGHTGLRNRYNKVFVALQADSRPYVRHNGGYGGHTLADWAAKQCFDLLRPRVHESPDIYETAIFWCVEGDVCLPEDMRDYFYIVSQDPMKSALCFNLGATGRTGLIWHRDEIGGRSWFPEPRRLAIAPTAVLQNNHIHLQRNPLTDLGRLKVDPDRLAHYDANSSSLWVCKDFCRTERLDGAAALEAPLEKLDDQLVAAFEAEVGSYLLEITRDAAPLPCLADVYVDGQPAGRLQFQGGPATHRLGAYLPERRAHEIRIVPRHGKLNFPCQCRLIKTPLQTAPILEARPKADSRQQEYPREMRVKWTGADTDIPASLGGRGPDVLHLYAEVGALKSLLLALEVRSRSAARVGVANFPLGRAHKLSGEWSYSSVNWAGEVKLEGDGQWRREVIPVHSCSSIHHHTSLFLLEGESVELGRVALLQMPADHSVVSKGGAKAALQERLCSPGFTETRDYTIVNDAPGMVVSVVREGEVPALATCFALPQGGQVLADGEPLRAGASLEIIPAKLTFTSPLEFAPSWSLVLLRSDAVKRVRLDGSTLRLESGPASGEQRLEFGAWIEDAAKADAQGLMDYLTERPIEVELQSERPETVRAAALGDRCLPRVVKVTNPAPGPYLVREKGWWMVRGAQPVSTREQWRRHIADFEEWLESAPGGQRPPEMPVDNRWMRKLAATLDNPEEWEKALAEHQKWIAGGLPDDTVPVRPTDHDLVKVYCSEDEPGGIQPWGYAKGMVRPGCGSQYQLALRDVEAWRCSVRVFNTTAYTFAPRIEFKKPVKWCTLDGDPWHYFDGNLVFLPQRSGDYQVEVAPLKDGDAPEPHITRTCASVKATDFKDGTLTVETELPEYVYRIPDELRYYAFVEFDPLRWAPDSCDGCDLEGTEKGRCVVKFRPGTMNFAFVARP